jgi:hypothetical protein
MGEKGGATTAVCSISSQDISRISAFAGGQLLSESLVPGIAQRGHVNESNFWLRRRR